MIRRIIIISLENNPKSEQKFFRELMNYESKTLNIKEQLILEFNITSISFIPLEIKKIDSSIGRDIFFNSLGSLENEDIFYEFYINVDNDDKIFEQKVIEKEEEILNIIDKNINHNNWSLKFLLYPENSNFEFLIACTIEKANQNINYGPNLNSNVLSFLKSKNIDKQKDIARGEREIISKLIFANKEQKNILLNLNNNLKKFEKSTLESKHTSNLEKATYYDIFKLKN